MNTTSDKGNIALFYICADLIEKGYTVLLPSGNQPHYDLVIEKDNSFKRVQVKYSTVKNGRIEVKLFTVGHKGIRNFHSSDNVDYMAIYEPIKKSIYYINRKTFLENKSTINLRTENPKNNIKNIKFAKDFTELRDW